MRKPSSTTVLVSIAAAVWLAACSLMTWAHIAYDDALNLNPMYWWAYGALILVFGVLAEPPDKPRTKTPRWSAALVLVLCTFLVYVLVQEQDWHALLYQPVLWDFLLMALCGIAVWLYPRLPFRRPMRPKQPHPPAWNTAVMMLVLYAPMLLVLPLYLAILHPVSVAQITPVGEAEGGRFIGRITGDRSQTPLGIYFFADNDRELWYYYDVLTGAPVAYDAPINPYVALTIEGAT